MVVRIGGIRKFTFDVSNKNGTAHREFGRDQVEFVRLQSLCKMTGKGIGKRRRLALVFNLRVIIVCNCTLCYPKLCVRALRFAVNKRTDMANRMIPKNLRNK